MRSLPRTAGCPIGLTPSVSSEQEGVKEPLPRLGLGQEVRAVRRPGVREYNGEREVGRSALLEYRVVTVSCPPLTSQG